MAPKIRLATEEDAVQFLEIYGPFCRETSVSFETEPPNLDEMQRRILETLPSFPWLVCEDDGLVLGYAYASKHRERAAYVWAVDVSVYIREGCRRGGIGRALYTALFAFLRLQGYYRALAGTTLPNPGSVGLHRAMGFQPVGVYRSIGYKCGSWHDVAWWELTLRDSDGEPKPPRELEAVRASREWDEAIAAATAMLASRSSTSSPP
jgi:L-amino acid N-acyltransferase YncA